MNYLIIKKSTIKDHNWFLDTNLLDFNTLRKDQIRFIEKNNDTEVNDLYNQIRKEKSVEKGFYLVDMVQYHLLKMISTYGKEINEKKLFHFICKKHQ